MTRYDPMQYGQVRLGNNEAPPAEQPDDFLFQGAGQTKLGPPADSSWDAMDAEGAGALTGGTNPTATMEFAADILGAEAPGVPTPVRARPAATPRSAPGAAARPAAQLARSNGAPSREVGARAAAATPPASSESAAVARAPAARRSPPIRIDGRRSGLSTVLLPACVFVGGGTAAAWLYVMQQNHVLGCIAAALSVVAAAFAWILLRG